MRIYEKRLYTKVEEIGKCKKVCLVTGFFKEGTNSKVGTITQSFVCREFRDGYPVTILNPTEEFDYLTVYESDRPKFTIANISWERALRILYREETFWGRFINNLLL